MNICMVIKQTSRSPNTDRINKHIDSNIDIHEYVYQYLKIYSLVLSL